MDKYDAECCLIKHFYILISMTILLVIVKVSFFSISCYFSFLVKVIDIVEMLAQAN